jgi:response regulator RpfG family c-di-GMP phosphodiesterase
MDNRERTVLVLATNSIDIFIYERLLERTSFAGTILVYNDTNKAIEYLKEFPSSKFPPPSLPEYIFFDINYNSPDSFKFLEEFHKLPVDLICKIKIVVFTTSLNPDDEQHIKAYHRVCNYIQKPLSEEILNKLKCNG